MTRVSTSKVQVATKNAYKSGLLFMDIGYWPLFSCIYNRCMAMTQYLGSRENRLHQLKIN
jgi:hypothetical protein